MVYWSTINGDQSASNAFLENLEDLLEYLEGQQEKLGWFTREPSMVDQSASNGFLENIGDFLAKLG